MKKRITSMLLAAIIAISVMVPFAGATFSDVRSNAWYAKDVEDVQQYGIITGVGGNYFDPETPLTVAQAIVMADRVHAKQNNISTDEYQNFTGSNWINSSIRYAFDNGILTDAENSWMVDDICTRMMMAKLFYRVFPKDTEKTLNQVTALPDVDRNSNTEYVFYLYEQGVLTGNDSKGTFCPDAGITRAETAAIINRVLNPAKRKTVSLTSVSRSLPELTSLLGKSKSQIIDMLGTNYQNIYVNQLIDEIGIYVYVDDFYYKADGLSITFAEEDYGRTLSTGVEFYGAGHVYGNFDAHMTLQQLRSLTGDDGFWGEDTYWDLDSSTLHQDGYSYSYYLGNGYGIKYFWKTDSTGRSNSDFVWLFCVE